MHDEIPFATRGYTDLWKREWNGRKVAVKASRFAPDGDRRKMTRVTGFFGGGTLRDSLLLIEVL